MLRPAIQASAERKYERGTITRDRQPDDPSPRKPRLLNQPPSRQECRAALERVTTSSALETAPRLAAFLRFVVDAALSGRSRSIKAYTVAVGALGRPQSFDPAADAIVRVEAVRLRAALAQYYRGGGANDPVVINMPRGCYVPEFRRRRRAHPEPRGRAMSLAKRVRVRPAADSAVYLNYIEQAALLTEHRRHTRGLANHLIELRSRLESLRTTVGAIRPDSA